VFWGSGVSGHRFSFFTNLFGDPNCCSYIQSIIKTNKHMILSNSKPLSTPFNFLKEHYGDHNLSFFQLQNNIIRFIYLDDTITLIVDVNTDSIIINLPITLNTPKINFQHIQVINNKDEIIESWVAKDYKWS